MIFLSFFIIFFFFDSIFPLLNLLHCDFGLWLINFLRFWIFNIPYQSLNSISTFFNVQFKLNRKEIVKQSLMSKCSIF